MTANLAMAGDLIQLGLLAVAALWVGLWLTARHRNR